MGPFTVLTRMLRDGVEHGPGAVVSFLEHEADHVRQLLAARVIHPGTGQDAQSALERAEADRARAENTPPS
jgi:hypothetical protein